MLVYIAYGDRSLVGWSGWSSVDTRDEDPEKPFRDQFQKDGLVVSCYCRPKSGAKSCE
jgi:hypothetical protein